jgi:acyl-CoA thioesterase
VLDAAWLVMLLDWFPPAAFTRVDPPTGGVSVDFTVHLHRPLRPLRADEWLGAEFETKVSTGGLALEQGRVFDPDGRLLAESFHTRYTG